MRVAKLRFAVDCPSSRAWPIIHPRSSIVFLLATFVIAPVFAELTVEEFQHLHRSLEPAKEAWQSIPWHDNLTSAQHVAIEQKKPLFIWAMDGHPLGCT